MNTTDLIQDAHMMLETIKMCKSPSVRTAAARQLTEIAAQLQSAVSEPEPEEEPPAMIDLAMKYRTRDGQDVHDLRISNNADLNYRVSGTLGINRTYWTASGKFCHFDDSLHPLDLIPTGEPA